MSEYVQGIATRDALPAAAQAEVGRLGAMYALCSDYRCFDDLARLFTDDAIWDGREFGFGRHEGRDAITAGIAAFCGEGVEQIHFAGQTVSWATSATTAGGISYFTAVRKTSKGTLQAYGAYEDEYRLEDTLWRIASRTLRLRLIP